MIVFIIKMEKEHIFKNQLKIKIYINQENNYWFQTKNVTTILL